MELIQSISLKFWDYDRWNIKVDCENHILGKFREFFDI